MSERWQVEVLNPALGADAARMEALRREGIAIVDTLAAQREDLARSRRAGRPAGQGRREDPPAGEEATGERWIHRPWARQLVRTLPPAELRALRLDRNRYRIRADEQRRLAEACIAVCGLSVGQAIAVCMAQEGVGTSFRLADPDHLDLSNLNRLRASIADLGVPKVTLAARALLDLDPYLAIAALPDGVRLEDPDALLLREDGRPVDLLVEECDNLPLKIALRRRARQLRIPVLMATTEGDLLDVERFDLEPERPLFHGLCAGIDLDAILAGDDDARTAFVMAVLGRQVLSARTAASMIELRETTTSWPQLASAVALGAAQVCTAARSLLIGAPCPSGRRRVDLDVATLPDGAELRAAAGAARGSGSFAAFALEQGAAGALGRAVLRAPDAARQALLEIATLAPSGGNAQPWCFSFQDGDLLIHDRPEAAVPGMDPTRSSVLLAIGAIAESVELAAPGLGLAARAEVLVGADARWSGAAALCRIRLRPDGATPPPALAVALRDRCTNRRLHQGPGLDDGDRDALQAAAAAVGAHVTLFATDDARRGWGRLAGAADRLRFLHAPWLDELRSEVRFEGGLEVGLGLSTLELRPAAELSLPLLLDGAVMAELQALGGGAALRRPAEDAFAASAAIALLDLRAPPTPDHRAEPFAFRAGRALQRVWLAATARGLGVHPWGSALYLSHLARSPGLVALPPWLQAELLALCAGVDEALPPEVAAPFMLLRLSRCPPPTARAGRLPPLAAS